MTRTGIISLALVLVAGGAATASAQKGRESKAEEKSEKRAFASAHAQSERLVRRIKLTADEKEQYNAIRKSYDSKYKDLEKQERSADKSGQSETAIMQQLEQLRTQERSEIRELLTATQQRQFDRNLAALKLKK